MYRIFIHKKVVKNLKNTPEYFLKSFFNVMEILKINPIPWKECDLKKIKGTEDTFRIRIGSYRIVYFIEKKKNEIHILKFEKRKKIYKN
jgi:mRNA interferase RelE/StbE